MNKTKTIIISKKITYSFFKERLNKLVNIDKKFTSDDLVWLSSRTGGHTIHSIPYRHIKMIEYYLLPFKIYLLYISENYLIQFYFRGVKYSYNMKTNHLKRNPYVL
jgi:hypothetical protein